MLYKLEGITTRGRDVCPTPLKMELQGLEANHLLFFLQDRVEGHTSGCKTFLYLDGKKSHFIFKCKKMFSHWTHVWEMGKMVDVQNDILKHVYMTFCFHFSVP